MLYSAGMVNTGEVLRIGELSKRAGVSPELLRAWERRYGLLRPARSAGGLRLYSPADVERVALMQQHLAEGMAAAEAAALAVRDRSDEEAARTALRPAAIRDELATALDAFDEPRAQAILDRLLALATVETLLAEVVVPYLQELGERWKRGEASVAQEHFASGVLRGRLLGLARGWGLGLGPVAVLACLPGEQHDLGLIAFGLALRSHGWRIVYLGPDSPIDTVADASQQLEPKLVVLNAVSLERVQPVLPELRALAKRHRLAIGGSAAEDETLEKDGILALTGDPTTEAARVTTLTPSGHDTPRSKGRAINRWRRPSAPPRRFRQATLRSEEWASWRALQAPRRRRREKRCRPPDTAANRRSARGPGGRRNGCRWQRPPALAAPRRPVPEPADRGLLPRRSQRRALPPC
jgi:MerR family transcriptional regulator, light-induced transcriptional regulator